MLGRVIVGTPLMYAIVYSCNGIHMMGKMTMGLLYIQSVYFIFHSMIPILRRRKKEIQSRRKLKMSLRKKSFFTPLSNKELEKLSTLINVKYEKEAI